MAEIELVIKIPEELYKAYKGRPPMLGDAGMDMIAQAISNGTPLPKGHSKLIEVTPQVEQELFTFTRYTGIDEYPYESAIIITDNAPTIIEADKGERNES